MGNRFSALSITILFVLIFSSAALSDSSSTNYGLSGDGFGGGGGNSASANYQVAETAIVPFAQSAMSSSNYASENKIGVLGLPIANINSVSPSGYSKFFSDGNASYSVSATDPDSDTLQYSAKQDSTTKVSAQNSSTLTWALSSADIGRHDITLQVIDPDGTVSSKTSDYVIRHPTK